MSQHNKILLTCPSNFTKSDKPNLAKGKEKSSINPKENLISFKHSTQHDDSVLLLCIDLLYHTLFQNLQKYVVH